MDCMLSINLNTSIASDGFEQKIKTFLLFIVSSKKNKNFVWKFFVRTETGGRCKIYQITVKTGGNTTNLKNHLKRKHKETLNEANKVSIS